MSQRSTEVADKSELVAARSQALQEVGRAVVNYQRMERLLKAIVAGCAVVGPPSDWNNVFAKDIDSTNRQTMGRLIDRLFHTVLVEPSGGSDVPIIDDEHMGAWFTVVLDKQAHLDAKQALEKIVKERNDLVHERLANFDPDCLNSCRTLSEELDGRREQIRPLFELLQSLFREMHQYRKELVQWVESEEFEHALEELGKHA